MTKRKIYDGPTEGLFHPFRFERYMSGVKAESASTTYDGYSKVYHVEPGVSVYYSCLQGAFVSVILLGKRQDVLDVKKNIDKEAAKPAHQRRIAAKRIVEEKRQRYDMELKENPISPDSVSDPLFD